MITSEQADYLIEYMETMASMSRHQSVMIVMQEKGFSEEELDQACKALGQVAGRDFAIL